MLFSGYGTSSQLEEETIRSSPYELPGIGTIRFTDGEYEGQAGDAPGASSLHIGQVDLFIYGDLDGDGAEDALTFLSSSAGGPEIVVSLEAFLNKNGRPAHAASYRIGDRVAIDSVTVDREVVHLYIITQGPDDAACCPTLHVLRKVRLQNRTFVEIGGL